MQVLIVNKANHFLFARLNKRYVVNSKIYIIGGDVMRIEEFRCPFCNKLVGKTKEEGKSISKVLCQAPKRKRANTMIFENKCSKCNKIIYIQFGFSTDRTEKSVS